MHPALNYAAQIAYSSREVLEFTYSQAVKYRDSPGVYVECGVAAGAQIIAMAAGAPNKIIIAYDSFEGIPLPSNKDDQIPGIRMLTKSEQMALPDPGKQELVSSGAVVVSFRQFEDNLIKSGVNLKNIRPSIGWFEDRVKYFPQHEKIAILRLDGDLYNSTYVCLKYLYPKVIKGGLVIIDDWALPGCRQAVFDYLQSLGQRADPLLYVDMKFIKGNDSTVAYWTK